MSETSKSVLIRMQKDHFKKYLSGYGIDIGCGNDPLKIQSGAVKQFDIRDGDAQYMSRFNDNIFDFVYSSHCLEHMNNIEIALLNWVRILKNGGHLFVIVPDWVFYEHEFWPSVFNNDHKFTFSLTMTKKDVNRQNHYHIGDVKNILSQLTLIEYDLEILNFDASLPKNIDQTLRSAICQIFFCFRKN